jgi:pyridoxamine 5'-phosphate oxidase
MKLTDIRREYTKAHLTENDVLAEPMAQFELWLQDAIDAELQDPTAMVVATVDNEGQPSQRIVLLKNSDESGFTFFTNLGSKKASDINLNNKVSLHFPWHNLERQVIVYGTAEKLSMKENMAYFLSRPKESQIAALASKQSHPISSRKMLLQSFEQMKRKFKEGEIPAPEFWGGYKVQPHKIEFWQGGEHRLHDRIMYSKQQHDWKIERLAP